MPATPLNPLDLYDVRSALGEDERMVQDTVARFVDDAVLPVIRAHFENHTFPKELVGELAALGLLGSAETLSYHVPLVSQGKALACALVSVAIAAYALRRYLRLLGQAEFVADQAICRACSTYGRLDLLDERSGGTRLHVRCKHCSEDWIIELPG